MSKFVLIALAVVLVSLGTHSTPASAQGGAPTLREIQAMIDSAKTLDPEIERYLPRWRIQEADLKIKIAAIFSSDGLPIKETDSMIVTATFPRPNEAQELLTLRAGASGVVSGKDAIRRYVGEALYRQILARAYAHTVIEPASPLTESQKDRIGSVFYPSVARQFVAVSAFRQAVQLGTTGARLEHLIGDDEIGYHFWSSGQGKAAISYPIIRLDNPDLRAKGVPDILSIMLGAAYRLKFGTPSDNFLGGVITPRLLNGTIGAKALTHVEYRLPQVNDIGFSLHAEVPFGKMQQGEEVDLSEAGVVNAPGIYAFVKDKRPTVDTVLSAYFLRTVAQGTVFWETWLNDYEHFFRISLGASYQEVEWSALAKLSATTNQYEHVHLGKDGAILGTDNKAAIPNGVENLRLIHPTELQDWIYAKVEYLNQSGFPFGMSAQLANRNLLISGFIPVIPNWLFLEAKYSTPILRDQPAPWESRSFFMISPVLRIKID
ncbi:MAG: hypothetical protein JWQ98_2533 [Chlorobi bacterium]|nr:hypothetical protein [Chlorobiota bacterium]